jgi:hypothetical protein
MIATHAYGVIHDYKKIGKTMANCLVCRQFSECQILRYQKYTHIFFFPVKILDEQYLFDWRSCKHRAILYEPAHVARYREEQVETRNLALPSYLDMKLQLTATPKKIPLIQVLLVLGLSVLFAALIIYIQHKLGIPFLF